ncbi:MAG TPA: minor capsid protein [Virgibacillus sp.]|nr:minor capsid protein [Virgibacillus sp.]HLR66765.1 minor capsid protein [Virgibacillus sp.]
MAKKDRRSKNSREYWREREIDHSKSMLKDENEVMKEIVRLYESAEREIEKETQYLLEKYAERNEITINEAKKKASNTDIRDYEDKAKKYVAEKDFSKKANEEMAIYNLKMQLSRLELLSMYINLELVAMTDGVEKKTTSHLLGVGERELKRQAGILGKSLRLDKEGIKYIAKRKFHDEDFSDRLWKNKNLLHNELEYRLSESLIKGQNPKKAAQKLRETIEQSVYASERILRTESARVQSEVQMESLKKAGYGKYEFIATERACKICSPMDGKVFDVKDAVPGDTLPPIHPNCRCSTVSHYEGG